MSHSSYDYKKHWNKSNYGGVADHNWDQFIHSFMEPGSVLDIGCAAGRFVETLTKHQKHYTGIDISSVAIEDIKKRYPELEFQCQDIVKWKPDRVWDNAFTWTVLEHIPHQHIKAAANNIKRLAKNIIIGEPYEEGADDSSWAAHCHNHNYKELFDVIEEIHLGSVVLYKCKGCGGDHDWAHSADKRVCLICGEEERYA